MNDRSDRGGSTSAAPKRKLTARTKPGSTIVELQGKQLALSSLEKVYYPATGFTKGQVIEYYHKIAPAILPHLKGRHLTLKRYPEGVDGLFFYEKRCPAHRPPWVSTAKIWSPGNNEHMYFCVLQDLPTLLWAVNLGALELHTPLARARSNLKPTTLAFDFDPGAPADITDCCKTALRVRDLLRQLGLESFPKTSGSKGLQLYVPLNTPATFEQTKAFARAVALTLEQETPGEVTSVMKKVLRKGKVFIDWSQNDDHKTTVCVYSLRAKERPSASTPVRWEEVESAARQKRGSDSLWFSPDEVIARFQKEGDLFAPVLTLKQRLPKAFSSAPGR